MDRLTDHEISAITALLSEDRLSTFQTMTGTTRSTKRRSVAVCRRGWTMNSGSRRGKKQSLCEVVR